MYGRGIACSFFLWETVLLYFLSRAVKKQSTGHLIIMNHIHKNCFKKSMQGSSGGGGVCVHACMHALVFVCIVCVRTRYCPSKAAGRGFVSQVSLQSDTGLAWGLTPSDDASLASPCWLWTASWSWSWRPECQTFLTSWLVSSSTKSSLGHLLSGNGHYLTPL